MSFGLLVRVVNDDITDLHKTRGNTSGHGSLNSSSSTTTTNTATTNTTTTVAASTSSDADDNDENDDAGSLT